MQARAGCTAARSCPSTTHPKHTPRTFFCSFLAHLPRRVYLPADSTAREALATRAHVTISVNNQSIPRDLDVSFRPLPQQEAASRLCAWCLKRLTHTRLLAETLASKRLKAFEASTLLSLFAHPAASKQTSPPRLPLADYTLPTLFSALDRD